MGLPRLLGCCIRELSGINIRMQEGAGPPSTLTLVTKDLREDPGKTEAADGLSCALNSTEFVLERIRWKWGPGIHAQVVFL